MYKNARAIYSLNAAMEQLRRAGYEPRINLAWSHICVPIKEDFLYIKPEQNGSMYSIYNKCEESIAFVSNIPHWITTR